MALPDFLIIGSPKAGSTRFARRAWRSIRNSFLSNPKEPKFFMCEQARPDPAHQKGPGDAHSAQEWVWDRGRLRGPVRRGATRGATRREHPVLSVGHGISPADSGPDPRREDDRGDPGPDRPRLFQLGSPVVSTGWNRRVTSSRRVRSNRPGSRRATHRSGVTWRPGCTAGNWSICYGDFPAGTGLRACAIGS